jgi:ankyrin repeat protein
MDKLLDSGIDIKSLDNVGYVLMIFHFYVWKTSSGKDGVNFICLLTQDGFTPLHKAIIGKKEAVVSHLLRKGANPHVEIG